MNTRLASRSLRSPAAVLALVLAGCLMPLPGSISSAQTSTTGNIEGTVVDVNGATVPNAKVTVTASGGKSASATTNEDGIFRITQLTPGQYGVSVEAPGFARFQKENVEVSIARTTKLDVSLNPAMVSGPVYVTPTPGAAADSLVTGTRIPRPELTSTAPFVQLTETTFKGTKLMDLAMIHGTVKVYLPDDIRAGDTISGTVVTEPKGANEEEKAKNAQTLKTFVIYIEGSRINAVNGPFSFDVPSSQVKPGEITSEGKIDMRLFQPPEPTPVWKFGVPYRTTQSGAVVTPDPKTTPGTTSSGAVVTPDPKVTPTTFTIPHLGQQGRPIEIFGPFDGDASNTWLRAQQEVDKALSNPPPIYPPGAKEFVEQFSNENFLKQLAPIAESPRKAVFIAPTNLTGPFNITLSEGGQETRGTYNNVAVNLSAPKLELQRGEKTTVHVEVKGLKGITKDVPLQLDATGVINMDRGNFQNLRIKPEEVKLDGSYTTDRTITAVQAGGFSVTATVIVGPFDVCLQDDVDPNRIFNFNSFTGDYRFINLGPSDQARTSGLKLQPGGGGGAGQTGKLQPGGSGGGAAQTGAGSTSPTGSTPGDITLTGIGKPAMKGCIITLSHNAPDRRVFARLDTCTKSGDAKVETKTPKTSSEVTDKNTENNTCPSSPK